jgi:hypothetical protein
MALDERGVESLLCETNTSYTHEETRNTHATQQHCTHAGSAFVAQRARGDTRHVLRQRVPDWRDERVRALLIAQKLHARAHTVSTAHHNTTRRTHLLLALQHATCEHHRKHVLSALERGERVPQLVGCRQVCTMLRLRTHGLFRCLLRSVIVSAYKTKRNRTRMQTSSSKPSTSCCTVMPANARCCEANNQAQNAHRTHSLILHQRPWHD